MIFGIVFISLLVILLLIIFSFFKIAFIRSKEDDYMQQKPNNPEKAKYYEEMKKGLDWYYNQPKMDVFIDSYDGLKLHGEYIKSSNSTDKVIILVHGYRSMARNDFCCAMTYYSSLGLDILLIDQRAHGKSEGKLISFGVKEKFDICSWVKYAKKTYGENKKIYLSGMSMGSSTVMMASNIVEGVDGIVADCGFTSPKEIMKIVAKKKFKLPKWFVSPVGVFAKIFGGFDYSYSTMKSLVDAKAPILFIHGSNDDFVPCYMTEQNFDACASEKKKIIVSGAPHGYSFLFATDEIKNAIENFILK